MNYTRGSLNATGPRVERPHKQKRPRRCANSPGRDRPGRGDMSKRTRWQPPHPAKDIGVPTPTPAQHKPKFLRTRDTMPVPEHLRYDSAEVKIIDAIIERTHWCIWPGCPNTKFHELMVCKVHRQVIADYVDPDTRWQQQRTAANIEAVDRGEKIQGDIGGHVYFVRVGDLIKIGYSTQPYQRLRAYPPNAEVLGVFPGTRKSEADLHGRFRFALQKGREWFRPADEILEYIAEMIDHYGPPAGGYVDRFRDAQPRQTMPMLRT